MEIHRYLRLDRISKKRFAPIRIHVHYNGKIFKLSTGEKVLHPEGWDFDKERIKKKQPFAHLINQRLDNIEKTLEYIYEATRLNRQPLNNTLYKTLYDRTYNAILKEGVIDTQDIITLEQLEEAFRIAYFTPTVNAVPAETFADYMQQWIESEKERVVAKTGKKLSDATIETLTSSRATFLAFESNRNKEISFQEIDKNFYTELQKFMIITRKQSINTFGKVIQHLKSFLSWLEDQGFGFLINTKYTKFKVLSHYTAKIDFLLLQELQLLQKLNIKQALVLQEKNKTFKSKSGSRVSIEDKARELELIRDIFLMCCYTSLRISDCKALTKKDIKGELIILDSQIKTGNPCYIPFYDDAVFKPVTLVEKYISGFDNEYIFPECGHMQYKMSELQALSGINRIKLTTKVGRKTFATVKIYQGVPKSVVMQATGHKTETSFNRYLGVDIESLLKIFKKNAPEQLSKVG